MKAFGKHLNIHMDPIHRDLLLITTIGFVLAAAIVGVMSFIFH
jgi:hypothetical protein